MKISPFVFVNGWEIISYTGESFTISSKELSHYRDNRISDDEVKSLSYSYLTSLEFRDFTTIPNQIYEF